MEFAVLLPLLAFLFVIGVDFARVFHPYLTITSAAHHAARFACQDSANASDTSAIRQVALDEAISLSTPPTVSSRTFTDDLGDQQVEVTVTWPFETITNYPGVPNELTLKKVVTMRVAQGVPEQP